MTIIDFKQQQQQQQKFDEEDLQVLLYNIYSFKSLLFLLETLYNICSNDDNFFFQLFQMHITNNKDNNIATHLKIN